jgi:hypothetical protein
MRYVEPLQQHLEALVIAALPGQDAERSAEFIDVLVREVVMTAGPRRHARHAHPDG